MNVRKLNSRTVVVRRHTVTERRKHLLIITEGLPLHPKGPSDCRWYVQLKIDKG